MLISVVTSVYKSEGYIREFYRRMTESLRKITEDYEIVLVDDGSPDNSLQVITEMAATDPKVRIIQLSRNFGAAPARWAGLEHAGGDYVFMLDADLEIDPEYLEQFYEIITTKDFDVVYAYYAGRKGNWFNRLSGRVFYRIFSALSGIRFVENPVWMRLMSRKYVNAITQYREFHLLAIGILTIAGFRQKGIKVEKRIKGYTSYTLRRKIAQTLDAVMSFSDRPLKIISLTGAVISALAFLAILYITYSQVFLEKYMAGWASTISAIFFIGGFNLIAIGVVGMYVGKTFEQTKQRPRAIVKNKINFPEKDS